MKIKCSKFLVFFCSLSLGLIFQAFSQEVGASPEFIQALTSEWKGERFPDGRPKVADALLERLKNISI